MDNNNPPKSSPIEDKLNDSVRETVDYLYTIKGDCLPELYQAIATLRQLINEEFKPRKSLSSQFIYDILNPAITTETTNAVQAELKDLESLPNVYPEKINGQYTHVEAIYKSEITNRLHTLQKEQNT